MKSDVLNKYIFYKVKYALVYGKLVHIAKHAVYYKITITSFPGQLNLHPTGFSK